MFGRRFAYEHADFEGDPREGRRGGRHDRGWWRHGRGGRPFFGWHMRRRFFGPGGPFGPDGPFGPGGHGGPGGPFGHGGPFGRGGPFGPGGPFGEEDAGIPGAGRRFFGRGDLKYALLELLEERPMHGYELMKALQERTGGMYTPSAGSVYPTLQMFEDRGFVTVSEVEGKKVYTITDAGREFLAAGQAEGEGDPRRRGFRHAPEEEWAEMGALVQELREFGMLFVSVWRSSIRDPEKRSRLRKRIEQVRAELLSIAGREQ